MENFNQYRKNLEQQLIEKAMKDEQFREQLIRDPREALGAAFGFQIPAEITLNVLQEESNTFYLVLPLKEEAVSEFELSESDLRLVSGGTDYSDDDSGC